MGEKPNDINDLQHEETSAAHPLPAAHGLALRQSPNEATLADAFARFRVEQARKEAPVGLANRPPEEASVELAPPARDPARRFLASRASPRTAQTMAEGLDRVASLLGLPRAAVPWGALRWDQIEELRTALAGRYSKRTVNVTLAALRGVARMAYRLGQMTGDDYERICEVNLLKVDEQPAGRWLPPADVERLLSHIRKLGPGGREWPASAYGAMLECLFALLLGAGLRASEAAALPLVAYDREAAQLRFRRKGDKERIAPLPPEVIAAVDGWLAVRAELDLGEEDALLVRIHSSGVVGGRLSRRIIERVCKGIGKAAGLGESFSPHDLRRTFATNLLDAGVDLAMTQELMSHEDPKTTRRYDRRPLQAMAEARARVKMLR